MSGIRLAVHGCGGFSDQMGGNAGDNRGAGACGGCVARVGVRSQHLWARAGRSVYQNAAGARRVLVKMDSFISGRESYREAEQRPGPVHAYVTYTDVRFMIYTMPLRVLGANWGSRGAGADANRRSDAAGYCRPEGPLRVALDSWRIWRSDRVAIDVEFKFSTFAWSAR